MENRNEKLQEYIKRLSEGEDLESVRKDFVENFKDVDASEIMKAEQDMMKGGVPYSQVQKLCDVHSALFHGATREEQIANAEKAVEASLKKQNALQGTSGNDMRQAARSRVSVLSEITGHPVNVFAKENDAIQKKIQEIRETLENAETSYDDKKRKFEEIRPISTHYAKKGDLLYPLLNSRYGISGPSQVMWGVDDEIRDEVSILCKKAMQESEWQSRAEKVLQRIEEMIYKEQNILLPICAQNFSDDEWKQMAVDMQDYDPCLTKRIPLWKDAQKGSQPPFYEDEITLPSGHFTKHQLRAVLNTLPLEISFVDDKDINRYFNEGAKMFKRPLAALDREVYYCHPPKIEAMVRSIIGQFRSGERKSVEMWMEKQGHVFLVRYLAVYDDNGKFVGTMECVENMDGAKEHFAAAS